MLSKTSIKCLVFATTLAFSLADKFERGDIVRVIQGNESGRDGKVLNRVPKRRSKGEKYCVEFADLKHSHQSNRRNTWKRIYAASNLNIVKKASQQVVKDEPASVIPARKTFVEDTWTHHRARNPRNSKPVGQNLEFESVLFHPLMNSPITPSSTLTNPKVESPVESVGFVFEPKKIRNALDKIATEKESVLQKAKGWYGSWFGSDSDKPKAPVQVEMVAITSKCKCLATDVRVPDTILITAIDWEQGQQFIRQNYEGTWKDSPTAEEKKGDKYANDKYTKSHEEKVFADYTKDHADKVDDEDHQQRKFKVVEHTNEFKKWFKITPSARAKIWNFKPELSRDAFRQLCYNKKRRRLMNRMVRLEQAMF